MILPKSWKRVILKDLATLCQYGATVSGLDDDTGTRLIRITDITDDGKILNDGKKYARLNTFELRNYRLEKGDFLIARSGSIGRTLLWNFDDVNAVFASYLIRIKIPDEKINKQYFDFLLKSNHFRSYVSTVSTGATLANINSGHILRFSFLLPPLLEQERIVTILEQAEKVKRLCDEILVRFSDLPALFFDEAVSKNTQTLIEIEKITSLITKGATPERNQVLSSGTNSTPFIKVNNISEDGQIIFTDEDNFVSNKYANRLPKRLLGKPKDIVLNIVGPPMGKIGLLTTEFNRYAMNQAVALLRVGEELEPNYLFFALRNRNSIKQILAFSVVARQVNLSLQKLGEIKIPFIALEKQQKFSEFVEIFFKLRENVLGRCQTTRKLVDELQALSFSGKLTQKWREQPDIATQLEQQAKARDALLAGQKETTPETEVVLEVPALTTLEARKDFAKRFQDLLKNDQKVQLQTSQDVIPVQYFDAFMDSNPDSDMYSFQSNIIQTFQNSDNPELQNIASELENILNTRAEYNPDSPTHPRKHFWYEIKDKDSPLRLVYNAIRIGRDYNNANTISQNLTELGHNLEKHKIVQALDTLESAGLIDAVLLEIPINQGLLSEVVQVAAYRLPSPSISVTVQVPTVSMTFTALPPQIKITQ